MNNYDNHNTTLTYLLDCALNDLEMENQEFILEDSEKEELIEYVQDNDCDIINELIDCMREQIIDKINEIIENRRKVFNVCFNVSFDVNLDIGAKNEDQLEELISSERFKRDLLDFINSYDVDVEIDHAEEVEYTEWTSFEAEDYI